MAKKLKGSVDYSRGMKKSHCGICRYYHSGSCEKVEGQISPDMWCKLYSAAKTTTAQ